MSESNLWAAWTVRSHDALSAAVPAVAPAGLALHDLAALTPAGAVALVPLRRG